MMARGVPSSKVIGDRKGTGAKINQGASHNIIDDVIGILVGAGGSQDLVGREEQRGGEGAAKVVEVEISS